jgi:hypothetical protein
LGKEEIVMWVFTKNGFVSAVRKDEHPEVLTIRARDRISLEDLAQVAKVEIGKSTSGDYPYRVFVDPKVFADWLSAEALAIDYDNYKNEVARTRGYDYAEPLHDVWVAMLKAEDAEAKNGETNHVDPKG